MMNLRRQQTPGAGEFGFVIPPPQLLSDVTSDFYNLYPRANPLTLPPANVVQDLYSAASAMTFFPHFGAQPSTSSYANELTQCRTIGSLRPVHTCSMSSKQEMMPSPIPLTAGDVAMENKFSTQYTGQGDHVSRDSVVGVKIGFVVFIILVFLAIFIYMSLKENKGTLAQVYNPYPLHPLYLPKNNAAYDIDLALGIYDCYLERKRLIVGELIASGNFGEVHKGKLRNRDGTVEEVAVKSLLTLDGRDDIKKFLREGVMMRGFNHQHVLSLIGVCFEDDYLRKSPLIVLPFMENGDLRTFLRDGNNVLTVMHLLKFCGDVAQGMKYLADKKFVHRDLAARNCMVDENWCVKVADFGLSRDLFDRDYYSSGEKTPLPWRWMSPESIKRGRYDEKTDVWSYAIVCWEIMTRGVTPYPTVQALAIPRYLSDGNRMEKPECCPSKLYSAMESCWLDEPTKRPTFSELVEITGDVIEEEKEYLGNFY